MALGYLGHTSWITRGRADEMLERNKELEAMVRERDMKIAAQDTQLNVARAEADWYRRRWESSQGLGRDV